VTQSFIQRSEVVFELHCRDVGFDCPGVVRGQTKEEVLRQAAEHAARVHETKITPEVAAKVEGLIRETGS